MKNIKPFRAVRASIVNEKLKAKKPGDKITIDVDLDYEPGNKYAEKAFKKFKLKVEPNGATEVSHDMSGTKQDIINYLQSPYYDFDDADIRDIYPELLETVKEELRFKEWKLNKTIIVPANDADDLNDEAQYFQSFLKKAGVKTEVEAGIGELEINVAQRDYKKAVKTIEDAGYQIDESYVNEEELNEAVGISTLAAAAIGAGILIRLGLMSDDKLKKTVDAAKETGKEAGKALKMAGNALARELPIIGKKIKKKELTARQLGELEKYLKDEISDKDVIEAMSEDPQLKAIIEAIAAGSKTHYHFYDRIKRIKGSPWATLDKKFKTLRKKILAGEVEESVNELSKSEEGDYYISTKSNVPSTWSSTNEILVDLKKFINGVGAANGADGVRDLIDVLEQVIRHAKKVEKKVN